MHKTDLQIVQMFRIVTFQEIASCFLGVIQLVVNYEKCRELGLSMQFSGSPHLGRKGQGMNAQGSTKDNNESEGLQDYCF